jgi:hypothetical protein
VFNLPIGPGLFVKLDSVKLDIQLYCGVNVYRGMSAPI